MKFQFKGKKLAKNLVAVASCGAMMLAFAPTAAFAASASTSDAVNGTARDVSKYVTCAAARAAMPSPEILGLSGIEDNGDTFSDVLNWSSPKYLLMGSDYNSNPNPYMYNSLLVATGKDASASPKVVQNTSREGGNGPAGALAAYGADDSDDAILEAKPDVILGTLMQGGKNADYDTAEYAGAVDPNWHPKSVSYAMSTMTQMIDMMYNLAQAGDDAAKATGKELRYGSAETIAQNFEKYYSGTRGYILKRLKDEGKKIKTVAVVSAANADGTVTLTASKTAEGTSSQNRYLEATESVAVNYGDTHQTATLDELKKNVDLVLIGGQSAGAGEGLTDSASISATLGADLMKKTYFVNSSANSSGALYGVVMNAVENAQNIGRILGCLYPEYVDQDDFVAYYYDNFYHIKSSKLADAIDNAMDGVVNWDATGSDRTQWTAADASTYKKSAVQRKINTGIAYLQTLSASKQGANKLTSHIKKTTVSKVAQSISVKPAKKTVSSKKASTITLKTIAQGKVTYKVTKKASKKISVSKAGKVTIKKGAAKGKYTIKVTAGATGEYKAASKTVTITVK